MLCLYLSLLETQEDKDKFERLYEKYSPLLKHVALQILQDEHLAEDAVHNAFLKIIKNFYEIGDISCHKTRHFLVIVTEHVAIDMLRKDRHAPYADYEKVAPTLFRPQELLDGIAVQELVAAIKSLPEIYRTVLELHAYHGMSERQIAAVLNTSYTAVRKRLERARAMLAAIIQEQEGEPYETVLQ